MGQGLTAHGRLSGWLAVLFAVICGLLILVPLSPVMPGVGLDKAWAVAANAAAARGLVFGQDFVFSMGPYAYVYSRMYLPTTDTRMLVGCFFLAVTSLSAVVSLVPPFRRPWLFALPVLITLPGMGDAILLCVPWLLVLTVAERGRRNRVRWLVLVYAMVCACALLLLVKGSFGVVAASCMVIAALMLADGERRHAAAVPTAFVLATVAFWCLGRQPLAALPDYFTGQAEIISGYGSAMSLDGRWPETLCIGLACLLLSVSAWQVWSCHRPYIWGATTLTLFIGFKVGVVRHDDHVLEAAATLILVSSYIGFTRIGWKWRGAVGLAAFLSLLVVSGREDISAGSLVRKTSFTVMDAIAMGLDRLHGAPLLTTLYNNAVSEAKASIPLDSGSLTADLYPIATSALVLNGAKWLPRPVIQSYSAYTPSLIERNVDYLRRAGPERIYWKVEGIDGRYPSLEDGASWLWLLGGYRPIDREGDYLVLARSAGGAALPLGSIAIQRRVMIGEPVPLPGSQALWAALRVRSTLAGTLRAALYKAPLIHMRLRYADGSEATFRVVPGMMETGFLLSPTVASTDQLQSLLTLGYLSTPPRHIPVQLTIEAPGEAVWVAHSYEITVRRLSLPLLPVKHDDALGDRMALMRD